MAANKKPRKKYRPRMEINTIAYVTERLSRPTPEAMQRTRGLNHNAVNALVHDKGTRDYWDMLNNAINLSLVLAEATQIGGYGYEHWGEINEAQKALGNIGHRFLKWGKWQVIDAEEALLMRFLDIHHAQIEAATIRDIYLAQQEVYKRIRNPKRSHSVKDQTHAFELQAVPEEHE